ncbi:hypothetical protein G6F46_013341 [Rhizopus delemar]|nr:hypothetical protein G6F51_013615 [Rhizopus arrhizus]KAG1605960.1 hypothetical protein G6F46_013341 [Rhizopus delemar]KAG1609880.1 hypothetical protein G6F45_013357 [Rhizopus arrhizus]
MYQGEQEHPQIFLARLKEAADLANITNDAVIESRFRAGLLREIKQFCIQSSSKNLQDWINHAEGWWNANRPRKIAMVDNPFIPRNANQALIYHNENYDQHHPSSNHNIDLIDTNDHAMPALAYNQIHYNNAQPSSNYYYNNAHGTNQLTTMDTSRNRNQLHQAQYIGNQHTVAVKTGRMFSYFAYTHYLLLHFLVYSNEIYFIRKSKLWTIIW